MEIEIVNKDGNEYKNIDLRKIDYNQSETLVKMSATPFEIVGQYGKSYMYNFWYNNAEVTAFVPEHFKTAEYGKNLHTTLDDYKIGDVLKITKKEGTMKNGGTFRFFELEQTGRDESVLQRYNQNLQEKNNSTPEQTTTTPNLISATETPNLVVTEDVVVGLELSNWEEQIMKGIKNNPSLVSADSEQKIKLFIQNNIPEERAKEIVSKCF